MTSHYHSAVLYFKYIYDLVSALWVIVILYRFALKEKFGKELQNSITIES